MNFYLVAFSVIGACLVGIGIIVGRRFPQLTLIDTESLPQERETKKKKQIIESRVRRLAAAHWRNFGALVRPVWERGRDAFRAAYRRLLTLEKKFVENRPGAKQPTAFEKRLKAAKIIDAAVAMLKEPGKAADAEKMLIEAVSLDPKNPDAYRGLGDLYMEQKNYLQARETYSFLARISTKECCGRRGRGQQGRRVSLEVPCDAPSAQAAIVARNFSSLAAACRAAGDNDGVKAAYEMVAAHEPSNPRHLDLLTEASILVGDKTRAAEVFERLKAANPENQKLGALAERIAALSAPVGSVEDKRAS